MAAAHFDLMTSDVANDAGHLSLSGPKAGVAHEEEKWGTVAVAGGDGKAGSHITLRAKWNVPPVVLFAIFTHPDNTALFRDIQHVGQRHVVSHVPGLKVVEVEQLLDVKVLWIHKSYSTWLKVVEDSRDQDCMTIQFDLMRSNVLAQFSGRWELRSIKDAAGQVVGCRGELNQHVLPAGIPPFLKHIPVLGDVLRGVTVRSVKRMMTDVTTAVATIKTGMSKGRAALDVLHELCGTCEEQAPVSTKVASFQLDSFESDSMDDEDEEAGDGASGSGHVPGAPGGIMDEAADDQGSSAHSPTQSVSKHT